MQRRTFLKGVAGASVLSVAACTSKSKSASSTSSGTTAAGTGAGGSGLVLDKDAWHWDEANDVYWQIGIPYVTTPANKEVETLGVYVPGAYLSAKKNAKGTYTATVKPSGKLGTFTARTAPIVLPVQTPGYRSQPPPATYNYSDVSAYLKAGFVYVAPGMRGHDGSTSARSDAAPWGVTDLKAAVRYVRYNAGLVPGDTNSMFVFGMSGGGAQSSVMGASGDSELYRPYLEALGAAMTSSSGKTISDAIAGVMAWCPVTSLDFANAAYEWNMGQFASTGTRAKSTWTAAYSADLATAFADYLNRLKLKDGSGRTLALATSAQGNHLAGSYYDHLVGVIQKSLNDFLSDTTFPYTPQAMGGPGLGGPGGSGGAGRPTGAGMPPGSPPSGPPPGAGSSGSATSTTYQTVAEYIAHLNSAAKWVEYDATSKTATVLSLAGFVTSQKTPTKDVGAFDGISRNATENSVLGIGATPLHFSAVSKSVIAQNESRYAKYSDWKSDYAAAQYTSDFAKTDVLGKDGEHRSSSYNPMYYLSPYYQGYKRSTVAPHWRIRTGIMQGDTANTTEVNLALALQNYGSRVDFATVWGQAHVQAERTGDSTANFIAWVTETVAK